MSKFFIFLFLILKIFKCNIITIPFKKYISPDINDTNFFSIYEKSYLYSKIKIGSPSKEITAQIKTFQYSLCIKNNSLIYNYISSSSYKNNGEEISPSYTIDYKRAIPSNETFIFGAENIKAENMKFMLTRESKFDSDGILGLKIHENNDKTKGHNLISQLKSAKLIDKEAFFFNFDENDSGELIIGDYPHNIKKFKDKYKEAQFKITNLHIPSYDINYDMKFRSVLWNGTEFEKESIAHIILESGYIIGSQSFEDKSYDFFQPFFRNKICSRKIVNIKYYAYTCHESQELDISTFPEINFYISDIEYNLNLTYQDLFIKKGDKIYFMVVFDKNGNVFWTLGDTFIKRNKLVFDMNRRILGIYDLNITIENETDNVTNEENKKKKIILIVVICVASAIIIGLVIFIIYKFVWKKRNKKPYELNDDDYEYDTGINSEIIKE